VLGARGARPVIGAVLPGADGSCLALALARWQVLGAVKATRSGPLLKYASQAVQSHPNGGKRGFARSSARTPMLHGAYV